MSIIISNLTKQYGLQKAVDNISFSINKGEIVGFIGPNGAGKSTTMKVITGSLSEFTGEVQVNNLEVLKHSNIIKQKIGYLPEHNPLYGEMYVREYLLFISQIYKIASTKRIDEIIQLTGLTKEQNKKIAALSKGYKQRVGIASALIHEPEVLILDEPTTGLDPNQIIEIRNLIASVGKDKTVMLSTHIMQEVEAICDRIIIINNGKIIADDKTENIKKGSLQKSKHILLELLSPIEENIFSSIKEIIEVKKIDNSKYLLISNSETDIRKSIFDLIVKHNNTVLSMQTVEKSLEDIFRELTTE